MLKSVFYLIGLVLGIPTGLILARMCKEEVKSWRKFLNMSVIILLALGVIVYFTDVLYKLQIILTFIFMIITSLTIVWKSYNSKERLK